MKIQAIKTEKIHVRGKNILEILDASLERLPERSILAITSKIVSLCEGRVMPIGQKSKMEIIKEECEAYIPPEENSYGISLTLKNNILIPMAGIDESNAEEFYVLWPENLQKSTNDIRDHLRKKWNLKDFGVIITDSKTTPLRWGTTGICLSYSGFSPLHDYRGTPDIFGRHLVYTQANIMDGLAAASVLLMGEGNEQTPLALIEDLSFVQFQDAHPSEEEIASLHIDLEKDVYAPLLRSTLWKKGEM